MQSACIARTMNTAVAALLDTVARETLSRRGVVLMTDVPAIAVGGGVLVDQNTVVRQAWSADSAVTHVRALVHAVCDQIDRERRAGPVAATNLVAHVTARATTLSLVVHTGGDGGGGGAQGPTAQQNAATAALIDDVMQTPAVAARVAKIAQCARDREAGVRPGARGDAAVRL